MKNTYQQTKIGGFKVEVFTGYDGVQLFITDATGIEIYAHRVSSDPIERAQEVIARETGAATVAAPRPVQSIKSNRICLTERQEEFAKAIQRGLTNKFEVWEDFDFGDFVCVNKTNRTEYRVKLETVDGRTYSGCECPDWNIKNASLGYGRGKIS